MSKMHMATLDTPLSSLPYITTRIVPKIARLGLFSVRDLLYHFPARYEDYSAVVPIAQLTIGATVTVIGTVAACRTQQTWQRRMTVTEALVQDATGTIRATWFNQPYLADTLKKGMLVRVSGKVASDKKGTYLAHPSHERAARTPTNTARLVPIYPETEGITSRFLRWQIQMILEKKIPLPDPLPQDLREKLHLPALSAALHAVHFPQNSDEAARARKRFAFEEMFVLQLTALRLKARWKKEKAVAIPFAEERTKKFVASLQFRLTNAQRTASFQIIKDLAKDRPMNRLLNGDVGSGKTIVAAVAALDTATAGHQVALLAPTELLARQHFESFCSLFTDDPFSIALLTSSHRIVSPSPLSKSAPPTRPALLKKIKDGGIRIVIGTHALLQKDVMFRNLALVIVDEQHRFGVAQRAYLQQKAAELNDGISDAIPHFLTMTATPIPRTLTLAFFGNLDLSVLDEMPKDRKPIITKIVSAREYEKIYEFIRREIKQDHQAYVILPLVEESKALKDVKAAVTEQKRLAEKIFPMCRVGLLHGRLKIKEKDAVMRKFKDGAIDILVATAVVEVGIDVPNATVMLIEDADRFGLSQLHQFRGRIGRGTHQSYCFLFSGSESNKPARLRALEKYTDGFAIAEEDLAQRGPGEFFGTRQSGLPDLAMENIANVKMVSIASDEASALLHSDPSLSAHPLLAKSLHALEQTIHLE